MPDPRIRGLCRKCFSSGAVGGVTDLTLARAAPSRAVRVAAGVSR